MVFIAVHAGAGKHPSDPASETGIKKALKRACTQGLKYNSVLDTIVESISVLEDDGLLNAGYGSNLTLDGMVECDASIMKAVNGDDEIMFGSVGALPGVKNPIKAARAVLDNSNKSDTLGRIPPMILAGQSARSFLSPHLHISSESLICPRAKSEWGKWIRRLEKEKQGEEIDTTGINNVQDTVGAVVADGQKVAAGVSSGGILLKHPGRIGEAAVYGAGCWAQKGFAISVTGSGEHIIKAALASAIAEAACDAEDEDIYDILNDTIRDSQEDYGVPLQHLPWPLDMPVQTIPDRV